MSSITFTASGQIYDLTYDDNGNLTRKANRSNAADATTYTWDSRNRLTRIDVPAMTATLDYDALGRRVARTVNGTTTRYFYDGAQAIGEITGGQQTSLLTGLGIDEVIARYTSAAARTYLTDALGSVIAQAREDRTLVNRYRYSGYGEATPTASDEGNSVEYTARENDGTGLYFYRARYYDPVLKRFVSEDPIGLAGGVNTYAYADGSPSTNTDPLGLKTLQCTKPLTALTDKFGSRFSRFAHDYLPAAHHQYSCVVDKNGKETSGGQDHPGSPLRGPGKPSADSSEAGQCKEIEPDNNCFEECLIAEWAKPRPTYGIPFGDDCQEYDDDVIKRCRKNCKKKRALR